MRNLPPLASVRVFEAAARHGNFTRAGDELGMTQAAVSYQIKLLEERLGAPLFVRLARNVELTELGARLAPGISSGFDTLDAAFAAAREDGESLLSITCLQSFAGNWLAGRLGAFHLKHPGIAVRLDASQRMADFDREDVDVGIRGGGGQWPGLVSHHLADWCFTPMASPEIAATARTPEDLLTAQRISRHDDWWQIWFAAAGVDPEEAPLANRGLLFDSLQMQGVAAVAGQGFALLMPMLFEAELASGRLVQPFPILAHGSGGMWLVYPERKKRSAKVRAFREWLLAELPDQKSAES